MSNIRLVCKFFVLNLLVLFMTNGYAASFDCAKAGTKIEKMICSSASLNKLDSDLAGFYKEAVGKEPSIKQDQLAWIKERNKCSTDACLEESYKDRINSLTNFIVRHDRQALAGNDHSANANIAQPESPSAATSVCASSPLASGCPLEFLAVPGSSWTEGKLSNQSCASYISKDNLAPLYSFKNSAFIVSIPSQKFQKEFATRYEVQNASESRFKMIQSVTGATVVKYFQFDKQRRMLIETRVPDCINCGQAQRAANSQGLDNLVACKN